MSLDLFISDTNEIETAFVCRNFHLGDKVKAHFKGNFYSGKIVKKWFGRNGFFENDPWLLIKTDKKVDYETDALLNGYGLQCPADGKDSIYFEDEPLPYGDEIYRKSVRRIATPEEIKDANRNLPF